MTLPRHVGHTCMKCTLKCSLLTIPNMYNTHYESNHSKFLLEETPFEKGETEGNHT